MARNEGHKIKHLKGRGKLPNSQSVSSSDYAGEQKPMK